MLLEFRISSTQSPLGKRRAGGIETLDRPRPEGRSGSMFGYFEGSWEQVMSLIGDCQEALRDEAPRGLTLIIFDDVDDQLPQIASQSVDVKQKAAIHSGRIDAKSPVRHLAVSQLR
jgi:uncharacterized protein YqgV (UPF0045/DUF77 family)